MILRWVKRIILGVLLLLLILVGSISALVATEGGSRWVIDKIVHWLPETIGTLAVGNINGNLLTGLDVSYFDFQQSRDGALNQGYRAQDVSFRWQPLALFYGAVSVQALQGKNIVVILPPANDNPPAEPFSWPSFALPVRIELDNVQLQEIRIQQAETPLVYLHSISGSLSLGTFNFRLNEFAVTAPAFGVEVTGRIGLRPPYAASLAVDWHYAIAQNIAADQSLAMTDPVSDASDPQPVADPSLFFSGAGRVRGDIKELDLEHKLSTPFVIASVGNLLPNFEIKDGELHQAPQATLENEWQDQTLLTQWFPANQLPPTTSATLDVSGWYDNYHALLDGEITREGIGDFSVAADVRGNLQQVDIAELIVQQIQREKSALIPDDVQMKTRGQVRWLPSVDWDLAVEAEHLNPAYYFAEWPGNLSLAANVKGSYGAREDVAEKSLAIKVDALTLAGQLRGLDASGRGDIGFDGQRWHSQQLQLALGANQLMVSGSYSDAIELQWQLNAPLLAQIDPGITGSLSTRGKLQGSLTDPRVEAVAQAKDLKWQDYVLDHLDLKLQHAAGQYTLALTADDLHLAQQHLEKINVQGSGELAQHQLNVTINSADHGDLSFALQSGYRDAQWRGKFNTLEIDHRQLPRWWLSSSDWITVDAQHAAIGKQCLTTRVSWRTGNDGDEQTTARENPSAVNPVNTAREQQPRDVDVDVDAETPQLCITGQWDAQRGIEARADLHAAPLRQARAWLKPDVTLGGVMDGELTFRLDNTVSNKTSAFSGMTASLQLQTRDGELRYQYMGEEPNVYAWRSGQVKADLRDEKLDATLVSDWAEYGDARATAQLNLVRQDIAAELIANFSSLAPLEAFIPLADDVQGRLAGDLRVSGKLDQPQFVGQLTLVDGSAKLPRLGVQIAEVEAKLESQIGGRLGVRATAKSGEGHVQITGDLNNLGAPDWTLDAALSGEKFQVLQQPQLKANVSPDIKLTASSQEIRLEGDTIIPSARADIKTLPPSATRVSKDVVIIDDENAEETAVAGIPVFMNLNIELGKDVHFAGFGLDSKLVGKINILQSPPRALMTTGYVSVIDGKYKAYGQELEIARGRLLFQGPYDNPGLDISALRRTPEHEVSLEIGGTLQQPSASIKPVDGLSESQSMALLLTGKPLAEASAADAYMLISAVSGLGMDKGPGITEEIARAFHLDELTIKSDDGFEQSSLWVGKYLSPKLFVRYVVGLFDQAFSIGVQYQMTERLRLEAESGEAQSIDMIYKIER